MTESQEKTLEKQLLQCIRRNEFTDAAFSAMAFTYLDYILNVKDVNVETICGTLQPNSTTLQDTHKLKLERVEVGDIELFTPLCKPHGWCEDNGEDYYYAAIEAVFSAELRNHVARYWFPRTRMLEGTLRANIQPCGCLYVFELFFVTCTPHSELHVQEP